MMLPPNAGVVRAGAITLDYPLVFEPIAGPQPISRSGAIASAEGLSLMVTRTGDFHRVGASGLVALKLTRPFDTAAMARGMRDRTAADWIGTHDLVIRRRDDTWQLFLSHTAHDPNALCVRLRVVHADVSDSDLARAEREAVDVAWREVYASRPCIDSTGNQIALLGGGAMHFESETDLLIGIGTYSLNGLADPAVDDFLRSPNTDYGKIVRVDIETGAREMVSRGHRDPTGLARGPDGGLWMVEHGPRGGDELNLVRTGLDFGWPHATYGTDYGKFSRVADAEPGADAALEPPVHAWVPSIAPSSMLAIPEGTFPRWKGDLLIASLKAATLYRVRVLGGRVVYVEPILVGARIRDIAVSGKYELLILMDRLPYVLRAVVRTGQVEEYLSGDPDGAVVFCAGCHDMTGGERADAPAPPITDILGADVAARPDFAYSQALATTGGTWTLERLAHFLDNPQGFAPGTTHPEFGMPDPRIGHVLQWLREPKLHTQRPAEH